MGQQVIFILPAEKKKQLTQLKLCFESTGSWYFKLDFYTREPLRFTAACYVSYLETAPGITADKIFYFGYRSCSNHTSLCVRVSVS